MLITTSPISKLKPVCIFILFVSIGPTIFSQENLDPLSLIGKDPQYVYSIWGVPEDILTGRGEKAEWDYAVFHKRGYYLYWIADRVWQIRFDDTYEGSWKGLKIGTVFPAVDSVLGQPWKIEGNVRIYAVTGYPYPLQIRCYFEENSLIDVYIYRSAF